MRAARSTTQSMFSWLLGSSQAIPYDIGAEVEGYAGRTIWKLFTGKDKKVRPRVPRHAVMRASCHLDPAHWPVRALPCGAQDGAPVSIFICRLSADRSEAEKAAARNALKRFKTIKHPCAAAREQGCCAAARGGGQHRPGL